MKKLRFKVLVYHENREGNTIRLAHCKGKAILLARELLNNPQKDYNKAVIFDLKNNHICYRIDLI